MPLGLVMIIAASALAVWDERFEFCDCWEGHEVGRHVDGEIA
jgi:hypothetical protein